MVVLVGHHHEALVLVGADGLFIDQHGGMRLAATQAYAGVQAGEQLAVGVVEHGAHADGAGGGVQAVVHRADAALAGVSVLIGQAQFHRDGGASGAGRVDVFQEALFIDVEGGVHLGHRNQGGQRGIGRTRGDHIAQGDFGARDAARDWGGDAGVFQVQAGGAQGGAGGGDIGRGFAGGVLLFLEVALGDGVVAQQALAACQVSGGVAGTGLGAGQLGFGAGHFGFIGTRVDGEEHIALLDQRAILEMHGGQRAADQGAHFDAVDRFDAAGVGLPVDDLAADHLGHVDRRAGSSCSGGGGGIGRQADHRDGAADRQGDDGQDGGSKGEALAQGSRSLHVLILRMEWRGGA